MTDSRNKTEGRNRLTARVTIKKKQRSVLVIKASDFWPSENEEENPQETEATF